MQQLLKLYQRTTTALATFGALRWTRPRETTSAVRESRDHSARRKRAEAGTVRNLARREPHGAESSPVVRPSEDDNVLPSRRRSRDLDRGLDGLRAAGVPPQPVVETGPEK